LSDAETEAAPAPTKKPHLFSQSHGTIPATTAAVTPKHLNKPSKSEPINTSTPKRGSRFKIKEGGKVEEAKAATTVAAPQRGIDKEETRAISHEKHPIPEKKVRI
jgi:hypothetical protein